MTHFPWWLVVTNTAEMFVGLNLLHSTGGRKKPQGFTDEKILKITALDLHGRKQEHWQGAYFDFLDLLVMKSLHRLLLVSKARLLR